MNIWQDIKQAFKMMVISSILNENGLCLNDLSLATI